MKRLTITASARHDLNGIADYIEQHNASAAARIARTLLDTMRALALRNTGRYGRVEGTYEKSVTGLPFIVVYHFTDSGTTVEILRILHTRRNWPAGETS